MLLAIGAGADLGIAVILATALVAVAVLAAATAALPPEGPVRLVAVWAGRLLSAAGVVACVLLVIDGVYDV